MLGGSTRMKTAIWTLVVATVCTLAGLAYKSPAEYRAIALWVFGIMTFGIFVVLLFSSTDMHYDEPKIFDRKAWGDYYDLRYTLGAAWLVVTVFLFCLWMLPHILPTQQSPPPQKTSSMTR
jgi:hypothetical protein